MSQFSLNKEFDELMKVALTEERMLGDSNNNNSNNNDQTDNKITVEDKSAKSLTTRHIKSRNFLSNISYVGITKEDFYNKNFVFDAYSLITKNLNLFSLK